MMNSNILLKFAGYGVFVSRIEEIMRQASETLPGIIEIATQAEVDAGVDDSRAVTPKKQKIFVDAAIAAIPVIPDASETESGKIEIATQAEVDAGSDDLRAVTPKKQKTFVDAAIAAIPVIPNASETQAGKIEIATQAEVDAGSDDSRAVTPLKQKTFVNAAIAAIPAASESQAGKAEIATQAETDAGTDDSRIVTPLKMKNFSGFPAKVGYCLTGHHLDVDPADSTVYAIGANNTLFNTTFGAKQRVPVPKSGTIKAVHWLSYSTTAGSNESIELKVRLNNSIDTLVGTVSANTWSRLISNNALSIAVSAGDYIELKLTTPAWATNPLTMSWYWAVYIE